MDKLTAHLDRAWDLLDRNDLRGARSSARRALDLDSSCPDAHCVLGHISSREGDADEALEHYRTAYSLDDGFIDPMLGAAELLIHPVQDYDAAISMCDSVLEFAEEPEEVIDATLLKFDALLAVGREDQALSLLRHLPDCKFEGALYPFMIGRAWYDAGDAKRAIEHLSEAIRFEPRHPDAHYFLGLAREEVGDLVGATHSFLHARALDEEADDAPWSISSEALVETLKRALASLEPGLAAVLADAFIVVQPLPGAEVVVDGIEPRCPVLIQDFRHLVPSARVPLQLFIYQRNLERLCAGADAIEQELVVQLTEEARHALREAPEPPPAPAKKTRKRAATK